MFFLSDYLLPMDLNSKNDNLVLLTSTSEQDDREASMIKKVIKHSHINKGMINELKKNVKKAKKKIIN
jgi:hypothetical protein